MTISSLAPTVTSQSRKGFSFKNTSTSLSFPTRENGVPTSCQAHNSQTFKFQSSISSTKLKSSRKTLRKHEQFHMLKSYSKSSGQHLFTLVGVLTSLVQWFFISFYLPFFSKKINRKHDYGRSIFLGLHNISQFHSYRCII